MQSSQATGWIERHYALAAGLAAGVFVLACHAAIVIPMRAALASAPYQNFIGIALISVLQLGLMAGAASAFARIRLFEHRLGLVIAQAPLLACAFLLEAIDVWQFLTRHGLELSALRLSSLVGHAMRLYAVFGIWSGFLFGLVSFVVLAEQRQRAERAAAAARQFELTALRRQIEPHFLFNALSTLHALIDEGDRRQALSMVEALSRVLRRLLDPSARETHSLGDEIEFTRQYLDIMKLRYGDRLRVELDFPRPLARLNVPALILQPLTENALKHARDPATGSLRLSVKVRSEGEHICIWVMDDGPGFSPEVRRGIGLSNIAERLELLYGDRAGLEIDAREPNGSRVCVRFPLTLTPED